MKKIKITKSQLNKINEGLQNKKVVKLTKKQYNVITESLNFAPKQKRIPNIVEFGTCIVKSINEIFAENNDSFELPDALVNLGVNIEDIKHRLLSDKIISVNDGEDGKTNYQFKGVGFTNWCEKYLNDIVSPKTNDSGLQLAAESELEEDYDGNHWNEDTPDAPWNDDRESNDEKPLDFEFENNNEVKVITLDTNVDVVVLKIHGEIVLFSHENIDNFKRMDIEQLVYNIINGYVLTDELEANAWSNESFNGFANGTNNFVVVPSNKVYNALKAVDYAFGEVGRLPEIFENIYGSDDITEVTTTGSVGGSYETPMAWAKDPKKPKLGKITAIKGGVFVKPELIDDFDGMEAGE